MRDDKVAARRHVAFRHADNVETGDLSADALADGLHAETFQTGKLRRQANHFISLCRHIEIAVAVRHQIVIQCLCAGGNHLDNGILGRRGFRRGNGSRHHRKALERILIRCRCGLLIDLQAQHVGGLFAHVLIQIVALINGQRKRLVLCHLEFLHNVLHFRHRAVTRHAFARVIHLRYSDRCVHLQRLDAGEVKGRRGLSLDERTCGEYLCNLTGIFCREIDSHMMLPP